MREANRYEIAIPSLDKADRPGITDRYNGTIIIKGGERSAFDIAALCHAMNLRGVKHAMLFPTHDMVRAGGEGSAQIWLVMVEALDLV